VRAGEERTGADLGTYQLVADLEAPGCPACRGAGRAAWRYVHAVLWELVNDPGVRQRLRAAHGFCREHAMMAVDVAEAQAAGLGMALLCEDFLRHVRDEAVRVGGDGGRGKRRWRGGADTDLLRPHQRCRACQSAGAVVASYLGLLASHGPDTPIGRTARREGRWLCLPHLEEGLRVIPAGEERGRLVEIYLRGEAEVRRDLAEEIRKHDYRYAGEPRGREVGAWRRAVHLMVGAPLPRKHPESSWRRKTS